MGVIEKISYLLTEKNITGAKMSRDLGFSNASYSQWMNGRSNISSASLAKIADYLQVSTDYLLGITDNPSPPGQKEVAGNPDSEVDWDKISYAFYGEKKRLTKKDEDGIIELIKLGRLQKKVQDELNKR